MPRFTLLSQRGLEPLESPESGIDTGAEMEGLQQESMGIRKAQPEGRFTLRSRREGITAPEALPEPESSWPVRKAAGFGAAVAGGFSGGVGNVFEKIINAGATIARGKAASVEGFIGEDTTDAAINEANMRARKSNEESFIEYARKMKEMEEKYGTGAVASFIGNTLGSAIPGLADFIMGKYGVEFLAGQEKARDMGYGEGMGIARGVADQTVNWAMNYIMHRFGQHASKINLSRTGRVAGGAGMGAVQGAVSYGLDTPTEDLSARGLAEAVGTGAAALGLLGGLHGARREFPKKTLRSYVFGEGKKPPTPEEIATEARTLTAEGEGHPDITGEVVPGTEVKDYRESLQSSRGKDVRDRDRTIVGPSNGTQAFSLSLNVPVPARDPRTGKVIVNKEGTPEMTSAEVTVEIGDDIYGNNKTSSLPQPWSIKKYLIDKYNYQVTVKRSGEIGPDGKTAWEIEETVDIPNNLMKALKTGYGKKTQKLAEGKFVDLESRDYKYVHGVLMRGERMDASGRYRHWVAVPMKTGRLPVESYIGEEIPGRGGTPMPPSSYYEARKPGEMLPAMPTRTGGMEVSTGVTPDTSKFVLPYEKGRGMPYEGRGGIAPELNPFKTQARPKVVPSTVTPAEMLQARFRGETEGGEVQGTEAPTPAATQPAARPKPPEPPPPPPPPTAADVLTLPAEAEAYISTKQKPAGKYTTKTKGVSQETMDKARTHLTKMFNYMAKSFGITNYKSITKENIREFLDSGEAGAEKRTISLYLSNIKGFFESVGIGEVVKDIESPGRGVSVQHPQLTEENYVKLRAAIPPATAENSDVKRAVHGLVTETGARSSDIIGTKIKGKQERKPLLKKHITFDYDASGNLTGAFIRYADRKYSGDTKGLRIGQEAASSLYKLVKGKGDDEKAIPIGTNEALNRLVDRLQADAGIPASERATTHGLRGTYASKRFNVDGVSAERIAYELGDTVETVFESYVNISPARLLPTGSKPLPGGKPRVRADGEPVPEALTQGKLLMKKDPAVPDEAIVPGSTVGVLKEKWGRIIREYRGELGRYPIEKQRRATITEGDYDAWVRTYEPELRYLLGDKAPVAAVAAEPKGKKKAIETPPGMIVQPGYAVIIPTFPDKPEIVTFITKDLPEPKAIKQAISLWKIATGSKGTAEDAQTLVKTSRGATVQPPELSDVFFKDQMLSLRTEISSFIQGTKISGVRTGVLGEGGGGYEVVPGHGGTFPPWWQDLAKGKSKATVLAAIDNYLETGKPNAYVQRLSEMIQANLEHGRDAQGKSLAEQDKYYAFESAEAEKKFFERRKSGGLSSPLGFGPGQAVYDWASKEARKLRDFASKPTGLGDVARRALYPSSLKLDPAGTVFSSGKAMSSELRESIGWTDRFFGVLDSIKKSPEIYKMMAVMSKEERMNFLQYMDTTPGSIARSEVEKTWKPSVEQKKLMDIIDNMNKYVVEMVKQYKDVDHMFEPRTWYAPHIFRKTLRHAEEAWKDNGKIKALYDRGFMKERIYPDIKTAMDHGAELVTDNPLELYALRWYGMMKYVGIQKAIAALESTGDAVRVGRRAAPIGYDKVDRFGEMAFRPGAAAVLENYLSHTLWTSKNWGALYTPLQRLNHTYNMFQLGVGSFFHPMFTGLDAQVSTMAEGLQSLSIAMSAAGKGHRLQEAGKGLKQLALGATPLTVAMKAIRGKEMLLQYYGAGLEGKGGPYPEYEQMLSHLTAGGGGFSGGYRHGYDIPRYYDRAYEAIQQKDYKKFVKNAIFVPAEASTTWIMDNWVPWMKAGTFNEMMGNWIERNPGASHAEIKAESAKIWNHVDARLGAVRYDRLFIRNNVKNLAQFLIRAPGWKAGTITEIAGGTAETGKWMADWFKSGKPSPPPITRRMAYTLALGGLVGGYNMLLSYILTGEQKDGDFWAFRTGAVDEKGRDARFLLPSYMKDIYAAKENPMHYLTASTSPIFNMFSELGKNQTYYGEEVYRKGHLATDIPEYLVKQYEPFWMRAARRLNEREADPGAYFGAQFGVMPASPVYSMTQGEKTAQDISIRKLPKGPTLKEAEESKKARQRVIFLLRSGRREEARNIMQQYGFGQSMEKLVKKQAGRSYMAEQFQRLNDAEAARVWDDLNPQEKVALRSAFLNKLRSTSATMRQLPAYKRKEYMEQVMRIR